MKSKEALAFISKKAFEHIQASYPVFDEEGFENYEKSQRVLGVLIERDTPMKVKNKQHGICPVCEQDFSFIHIKYCFECGQRLDWSKEEEIK